MALINCPECDREVSDKAATCIHCGYPLENEKSGGVVRIKIPSGIVEGWVGLFSSRKCVIRDENENTLWSGRHGENAAFEITQPTNIVIDLGGWGNPVSGTVTPRKKYSLVQDMGVHLLATYVLSEVDVIDSD